MTLNHKNLDKTRWLALPAGLLIMFSVGYLSLWSLLVNPMIAERGVTDATMAGLYSAVNIVGVFMTLLGGKLIDKIGIKKILATAIISMALGLVICGATTSVVGFGIGYIIFICWNLQVTFLGIYANIVKLFPDRRGFALSIVACGTQGGAAIFSPIMQWSIDNFGLSHHFFIFAGIYAILGVIGFIFFFSPPDNYVPNGYIAGAKADGNEPAVEELPGFEQKDWRGMLKDIGFWLMAMMIVTGSLPGIIILSQMSWVAQDIVKVTAAQAALLVSAITITMVIGKLVWGFIIDRITAFNVALACYGTLILCMLGISISREGMTLFFMACCIVGIFCFGGLAVNSPVLTTELFGSKHFGFNFSIILQAQLVPSVVAPWVAAIGRMTGHLSMTFITAALFAAVAFVLSTFLKIKKRNSTESTARKRMLEKHAPQE